MIDNRDQKILNITFYKANEHRPKELNMGTYIVEEQVPIGIPNGEPLVYSVSQDGVLQPDRSSHQHLIIREKLDNTVHTSYKV